MTKNIDGLGKRREFIASRSFDTCVDPQNNKIGFSTKLEDSSELRLWMTTQQFQQSLPLLKLSAEKLGVTWP